MKTFKHFAIGMAVQIAIAFVAEAVTYHVAVWQTAAGFLIAVAVFAGIRMAVPAEKPKRVAKQKQEEPTLPETFEDIMREYEGK